MLNAFYKPYQLQFTQPVLTSRGQMMVKNGYYLVVSNQHCTGLGECSFIEGLSIDDLDKYEHTLNLLCQAIQAGNVDEEKLLTNFPSIRFGYQTAMLDLKNGGNKILFPSQFTTGKKQIAINGLVWMGQQDFMLEQINKKIAGGFSCIKIKVGAIPFAEEIALLQFIRSKFPADVIEIRLDANGAFGPTEVFEKLDALAKFQIHSIEQPIKPKQLMAMQHVCRNSPIPVALDEELIGIPETDMHELLDTIKPAYIILKPSLLGGLAICDTWIEKAEEKNIKWWATSALESNIGLNAIAQWVAAKNHLMVQGLGTGSLYTNNISSPLYISNGTLGFNPTISWGQNF